MKKFATITLVVAAVAFVTLPLAVSAAEPSVASASASLVTAGKMLYGPDGHRIATIYRVTIQGDVQIILDGKMVTVPAASLTQANDKLTTSLTKAELRRGH